MPLNAARLSASIKAKRLAKLGAAGVSNAAMTEDCDAIAEAVIEEFTTFAQVAAGIPVTTAGSATAQAGATTAPGVIT